MVLEYDHLLPDPVLQNWPHVVDSVVVLVLLLAHGHDVALGLLQPDHYDC